MVTKLQPQETITTLTEFREQYKIAKTISDQYNILTTMTLELLQKVIFLLEDLSLGFGLDMRQETYLVAGRIIYKLRMEELVK